MPEAVNTEHTDRNELFRHKSLVMDQCDATELFTMNFGSEMIQFKLCDLISFRKKIFSIELAHLFDANFADLEIIYLAHIDRHILLSLEDVLDIRELLSGTFAVMQINSQVHRRLFNPFVGNS